MACFEESRGVKDLLTLSLFRIMSQKHMRKIFLYMLPEHLNNDEYAVDMMRIDFVSAIDLFTSVK